MHFLSNGWLACLNFSSYNDKGVPKSFANWSFCVSVEGNQEIELPDHMVTHYF